AAVLSGLVGACLKGVEGVEKPNRVALEVWCVLSITIMAAWVSPGGAVPPRRAPLCLSVSVACPNQYVAVITKCCTEDFAQAGNREVSQDRRRPHQKSRRIPIPRFVSISCLRPFECTRPSRACRRTSGLASPLPLRGATSARLP